MGFDGYVQGRAKNLYINSEAKKLYQYPDSVRNKKLTPILLDNFTPKGQLSILKTSILKAKKALTIVDKKKKTLKRKRKILNLYDVEFYNRVAFSLSCLILFFIGAPLGSIIRKGGFGLPMILAICIYVLYFFINTFGRNLAEESSVTAALGSWISAIVMVPIGFFLTRRATKDMGIFNIDVFLQPITKLFKKINKATQENDEKH